MDEHTGLKREAFDLFDRLVDLSDAARRAELDKLRAERPDIHVHVARLLAADASVVESGAPAGSALQMMDGVFAAPAPDLAPGATLGPYRLERTLGQGGMGEVWLARRTDGVFTAPVALKVLRAWLVNSHVRNRFLREGRYLGELAHPHVARLLDAGIAPSGEPYLALEYVEGVRIDEWCDTHRLDVRARLRLFLEACDAVAHAHAHLIVHRDLKPSNILVSDAGGVKLLDFGIAKLVETGPELSAETELTRVGERALTLEYAAPEQVAGGAITTATDVYALGVLLYLLLCGRRPYGAPGDSRPQLERAVLEAEPPPLGTARAARDEQTSIEVRAERRDTTPVRLQSLLRGDLETIAGKALKKAPSERYLSVAALADDVRRFLDDEPVLARPDSFRYRARKYLRRHRLALSAASAVFVALVAGIGVALWQAHRAEKAKALAQEVVEFQGAMLKRIDIRQLASGWLDHMHDGLATTLENNKPVPPDQAAAVLTSFDQIRQWSQPTDVARKTLGDYLLEPAVKEIDQRFAGEPRTAIVLRTNVAHSYGDLGLFAKSQELLERAIAQAQPVLGPDAPEVVEARFGLAQTLRMEGRYQEGIAIEREVVAAHERLFGRDDARTLRSRLELGRQLGWHGETAEAIKVVEPVLAIQQRRLPPDDLDLLATQAGLGAIYNDAGDYARSKQLGETVLAGYRRVFGPDHPYTLDTLLTLAKNLNDQGDAVGAARIDEELVEARRRTLGNEHPTTIVALINLSAAVDDAGDKPRALALKEEAWRLATKVLGPDSPATQVSTMNYAGALQERGRLAQSEALTRGVVDARLRILGPDKPATLRATDSLASVLREEGRYAEAAAMQEDTLERQRRVLEPLHQDVLHTWRDWAMTLQAWGHHEDAVAVLRDALEAYREALGPDHADTLRVQSALASSMFAMGQRDEGLALQRTTLETARTKLGEENPSTLQAYEDLSRSLHTLRDDAGAQPLAAQAAKGLTAQFGDDTPRSLDALRRLADIDEALGRRDEAVELRRRADEGQHRFDVAAAGDVPAAAVSAAVPSSSGR